MSSRAQSKENVSAPSTIDKINVSIRSLGKINVIPSTVDKVNVMSQPALPTTISSIDNVNMSTSMVTKVSVTEGPRT